MESYDNAAADRGQRGPRGGEEKGRRGKAVPRRVQSSVSQGKKKKKGGGQDGASVILKNLHP